MHRNKSTIWLERIVSNFTSTNFKRSLVVFLIFLLVCLLLNKKDKISEKCLYPSVCIYNDSGTVGSGVVTRSEKFENFYYNVALTCEHLLSEDKRINPTDYRIKIPVFKDSKVLYYQDYPCVIYDKNEDYDMAIVIFPSHEKLECVDIDFNCKLKINDKIMKVGYGLGDDLRIDYGNITSINGKLNEHKNLYRMNAFAIFGDSGGPVFYNYRLVGITHGVRSLGTIPVFDISFASSIKNLKRWQNEINNIEFVYDKSKKVPIHPIYFLEFNKWSIKSK
jgi:hypothetical protein